MFQIFELGGRTISELRDPTQGLQKLPKRAIGAPSASVHEILEPGDIIVTRHRDALSNVFLPGFWPHAALFVGSQAEGGEIVEALKDGVKLRPLEETFRVDAFLVLRARVPREFREQAAQQALAHVGKLYDFAFDFRQTDRLACTALIYRAWHGVGEVEFELSRQCGRLCLSAENLLTQALERDSFELLAYFGPDNAEVMLGEEAEKSFRSDQEVRREADSAFH